MGRCWTPSQRTPVQYSADGSTCSPSGLGVPISKVGTVCVSNSGSVPLRRQLPHFPQFQHQVAFAIHMEGRGEPAAPHNLVVPV